MTKKHHTRFASTCTKAAILTSAFLSVLLVTGQGFAAAANDEGKEAAAGIPTVSAASAVAPLPMSAAAPAQLPQAAMANEKPVQIRIEDILRVSQETQVQIQAARTTNAEVNLVLGSLWASQINQLSKLLEGLNITSLFFNGLMINHGTAGFSDMKKSEWKTYFPEITKLMPNLKELCFRHLRESDMFDVTEALKVHTMKDLRSISVENVFVEIQEKSDICNNFLISKKEVYCNGLRIFIDRIPSSVTTLKFESLNVYLGSFSECSKRSVEDYAKNVKPNLKIKFPAPKTPKQG